MRRCVLLVVGLALAAGVAATVAGGATEITERWVITDLGPCPSYNCWSTMAINERGQVVGTSKDKAFLWQKGRRVSLGTLPGTTFSEAIAINERGQIVGSSGSLLANGRAFLWENGRMRNLGIVPGTSSSTAAAINDRGQVAGYSWTVRGQFELPTSSAFTWEKGKLRSLPALPGDSETEALGINGSGWIIGWSSPGTRGGGQAAVVWRSGTVTGLGKLGALSSTPSDINDHGQIVGWTAEPHGLFLWEKGAMRVLSKQLPGNVAIDGRGRVIGTILDRVFIWEKGRTRFIGSGEGQAVSERGQIVGWNGSKPRLWENGTWITLPLLRGHKNGMALALNERNQIAGWSGNYDYNAKEEDVYKGRLVLWTLTRGR